MLFRSGDGRNGIGAEHPLPFGQGQHHRLRQLHRLDGVDALRHRQIYKPGPGPQRSPGRQSRRPGEAPASTQEQDLAVIALVALPLPPGQQGADDGFCHIFHRILH